MQSYSTNVSDEDHVKVMTEQNTKIISSLPSDALQPLNQVISSHALEFLAREILDKLTVSSRHDWRAPESEINFFCQALCNPRSYQANKFIWQLRMASISLDKIYRSYLGEAARKLGEQWESDTLSFKEVSLAMARIYTIMNSLRRRSPAPNLMAKPGLIFAAVPGEQHTLGVEMATDLFRRKGWPVIHLIDKSHDEILHAVDDNEVNLIGLSLSGTKHLNSLFRLILALRVTRPDLKIIISGAILSSHSDSIKQIGVDALVNDIPDAVLAVESFFDNSNSVNGF